MLSESIAKLVQYGVETELIPECERNYTTNLLLDVFYEDDYTAPEQEFQNIELEKVLDLRKTNIQNRRKNMVILIWRKC